MLISYHISHTRTKCRMATILIVEFWEVRGMKTWKELTTGVQQLVRLLFNNDFVNPGLSLKGLFLVSLFCSST